MNDRPWRISSYSGGQGNWVVVAGQRGRVLIRDTKDRPGPVLSISAYGWRRFTDQVRRSSASSEHVA